MGRVRYRIVKVDGQEFVEEIHKVTVHTFSMGDVEDPDLYAAEPILKWQESDAGKFVMENCIEAPIWHRHLDYTCYGYRYAITAELEKKKLSEFYLRFGIKIK